MKKIIYVCMFTLFLSGCVATNQQLNSDDVGSKEEGAQQQEEVKEDLPVVEEGQVGDGEGTGADENQATTEEGKEDKNEESEEQADSNQETTEEDTKEENANSADADQEANIPVVKAPTQEDIDALQEEVSVVLKTSLGDIEIALLPQSAPLAVANFLNLSKAGFYDGVMFHRVIPNFMIQSGDPNAKDDSWSNDGTGGPGYQFKDEVSEEDEIVRGVLAMANSGPGTNGSQFFIVTTEGAEWLNGRHTIFGNVVEGMDVADTISEVERNENDHPLEDIVIQEIVIQ